MKFEERQSFQADRLKVVRFLVVDIFNNPIVKTALICLFVLTLIVILLQTHHVLMSFDQTFCLKNAPMYFFQIFVLISIAFNFYFINVIDVSQKECPKWQPNVGRGEVEDKFAKECRFQTIFLCCLLTVSFIGSFVFIIPVDTEREYFFAIYLVEEYFAGLRGFLIPVLRGVVVFVSILLQLPYCQLVYSFQLEKFRYYSLIDHLENINVDYEDTDPNLVFSSEYHASIGQRLEYCVKRHVELFGLYQNTLAQSAVFIVLFSVFGAFLNISLLLFILLVQEIPVLVFCRILYCMVVCVATTVSYIATGQDVEDNYGNIYAALYNVRWYHWSTKNQKAYLKMLMAGKKPLEIKFSDSVTFNYNLGLRILRAAYSICCLVYSKV